jgi:hypothetical protein
VPHLRLTLALAAGALLALPATAAAEPLGGSYCLADDPPEITAPAKRLRFGTTPLLAGSAGLTQLAPKPGAEADAIAALRELRPRRRKLILRLNRMFWADGRQGIRRYARIVDRYAKAGFASELQIRYHPPAGKEGDMEAWRRYVDDATRILARRKAVKALSITNEANFSVSPNTSDGSYAGVREAIIVGILAAQRRLEKMGRRGVKLGFSFAWRWAPNLDAGFWQYIGRRDNADFRHALDYVGLQAYPGLVWPPAPLPTSSAGEDVVEALTLLRGCYMPQAKLGREIDLWVTENGYPTNLGRSETYQRDALADTLEWVHRYSGELGVTDYRYFNLRDNRSAGIDLFDAVGLLRDDYSPKPAFTELRSAIRHLGR